MKRTENLNLYKPEQYDDYNIEVFNDNADIIDGAVANVSQEIASVPKLSFGTVGSFTNNVGNVVARDFDFTDGEHLTIQFNVGAPGGARLSINGSDPYPLLLGGEVIQPSTIGAGATLDTIFKSESFRLLTAPVMMGGSGVLVGTSAEIDAAIAAGTVSNNTLIGITDD